MALQEEGTMVDDTAAPETAVEPSDEGVKHAENDEDDEFESESDSEEESSDEEEEEEEPAADDDDDYGLLAMAKKRMAELKAKEAAAAAQKAEEDSDEDDDDEDSEEEDEEEDEENQEERVHAAPEEPVAVESKSPTVQKPVAAAVDTDDLSVVTATTVATTATAATAAVANTVPKPKRSPRRATSFRTDEDPPVRRKKRDENAELWALLRQSKSRVAETKDLVEKVELRKKQEAIEAADTSASDLDVSIDATPGDTNKRSNKESNAEEEEKKDDDPSPEGDEDSEEELDEETKRQREFERENQELVELLAASRKRLEQAALAQVRKAEAAAARDDASPKKVENPYAQINALPDEVEPESQEQLTQKDLLLAMAVAEEAARSGKDNFETPARDELRTRDLDSFDFLKEDKKPEPVPTTPITSYKEQQHEQNRFDAIAEALMTKWTQFKKRVEEIDYLHNEQSVLSQQVKLMG